MSYYCHGCDRIIEEDDKTLCATCERTPMPDQPDNDPMKCRCATWGSDNMMHSLLGNGHHERCEKHVPLIGAIALITSLVRGMEEWASDEDGVHPGAWGSYVRAKQLLGERLEDSHA